MNFISQMCVKELDLPVVEERPPRVNTLDGHPLQTYGVHRPEVRLDDSKGERRSTTVEFVAANMIGYDMILGMPWLDQYDPDIRWSTRSWTWRLHDSDASSQDTPKEDILFVGAASFLSTWRRGDMQLYAVYPQAVPPPWAEGMADHWMFGTNTVELPEEYQDYAHVFSEEEANKLPDHGPHDHAIETGEG